MDPQSVKILVVDDDARNVRVLKAMLNAEGHATVSAGTGEEALQMAEKEIPGLILLDVMMPDMNGFEVVEKLKALPATCNIPIIMVTALDDRESRLYALQAGADEFISKPVDRTELALRIKNILTLQEYRQQTTKKSG
ncbi:MAG: response regulator [Methylophilaceae bacterium]|nr:response regulator [Methylophilaceae bacterium]